MWNDFFYIILFIETKSIVWEWSDAIAYFALLSPKMIRPFDDTIIIYHVQRIFYKDFNKIYILFSFIPSMSTYSINVEISITNFFNPELLFVLIHCNNLFIFIGSFFISLTFVKRWNVEIIYLLRNLLMYSKKKKKKTLDFFNRKNENRCAFYFDIKSGRHYVYMDICSP